jgi:Ca2+-binding EF-hand superfamily protein
MMTRSLIAALAILALASGCSAAAQPGPGEPSVGADDEQTESMGTGLQAGGPHRGGMFAEADKDNDGKVTLAEANAASAAKFAAADTNRDGFLDAAELAALKPQGHGKGPGQGAAKLDKDGDGKLTKAEAPPRMQQRFDELDVNKDGVLDQQELQAARASHGGGGGGMIARLDKNGDGKVTKDEAPAPMQQHFDALDANKDGAIDQQELQAAHAARGAQGPRGPGRMAHLDADKDGKVSQAEFVAGVQQWFSRMDADGDGVVTRQELRSKRPGKHAR